MIQSIILQATGGGWDQISGQMFFLVAIIGVFYFFMIRPQQKKAKDSKKFIEEIKKGDLVVTIGGAHGRVAEIEDDTLILEFERGVRIKFSKSSVSMESSKTINAKKTGT